VRIGEASGSRNQREEIEAVLAEQRELAAVPSSEHLTALISNSDIFVQLKDIPEEKRAFEDLPFEDWMLYLHPDQKALVHKRFNGPARLRGVSGSGKTVVAIHRVREAARNLVSAGSRDSVLFLTYNRSLCELVERLLRKLCTATEFGRVQVSTIGKWCQDYIQFRTDAPVSWKDDLVDAAWTGASEICLRSSFLRTYFASMTTLRNSTNQSGLASDEDHRMKGNSRTRSYPLDFRMPSQSS